MSAPVRSTRTRSIANPPQSVRDARKSPRIVLENIAHEVLIQRDRLSDFISKTPKDDASLADLMSARAKLNKVVGILDEIL